MKVLIDMLELLEFNALIQDFPRRAASDVKELEELVMDFIAAFPNHVNAVI